jgi:hypothetical protein
MSLGTILLIILVLVLLGAIPTWPHSRGWDPVTSGAHLITSTKAKPEKCLALVEEAFSNAGSRRGDTFALKNASSAVF